MPLIELAVPADGGAPPPAARALIREAGRRIERFQRPGRAPAFVPCDFVRAYGALRAAAAAAPGRRFCEWGSGFGVVAGLAALLDFDACGIEIDADLTAAARRLADDFGLPVEFACGSFVPPGGEACLDAGGAYAWLATGAGDGYDELGLGPDDFDVIFAYPWPDEEAAVAALFGRYAAAGALLLTYHGGEGFRLRRKARRRLPGPGRPQRERG